MSAEIIPFSAVLAATEEPPVSAARIAAEDLAVPGEHRTDLGNAKRLVRRHGVDMRFTRAHGWLVWDGTRWAPDTTGQVVRFAKDTVQAIYVEASAASSAEARTAIAKHATNSEAARRIMAMLSLAETELPIAAEASWFDRDPWLLNVRNGTIDLRTGEIRPHAREDLLTKCAPVEYDAAACCDRFVRFLEEVQPDADQRAYLQRLAGYACTGVIREHVLPVFYGSGRNGKGVFTNALLRVLGEYGLAMPSELLMAKKNDEHPTGKADLCGVRFAVGSETEENRALATAFVKQATGGDPIRARKMHKDHFTFEPTHKLVLATNHRPVIKETKNAIWDRVHLVPWDVCVPPERQDLALGEKLRGEAAGILRWMVEGCLAWQRDGLSPPPSVVAATKAYRRDMDHVGDFLEERCVTEAAARVTRTDLRMAYETWADAVGQRQKLDSKSFAEALRERGFLDRGMRDIGGRSVRGWVGLRLRTAQDDVVTSSDVDIDDEVPAPKPFPGSTSPESASTPDDVSTETGTAACGDREVFEL